MLRSRWLNSTRFSMSVRVYVKRLGIVSVRRKLLTENHERYLRPHSRESSKELPRSRYLLRTRALLRELRRIERTESYRAKSITPIEANRRKRETRITLRNGGVSRADRRKSNATRNPQSHCLTKRPIGRSDGTRARTRTRCTIDDRRFSLATEKQEGQKPRRITYRAHARVLTRFRYVKEVRVG